MNRLLLGTAAALTTLAALLFTATATSAHSRPIRFDPAPGSVLDTAPAGVTGWFTSPLRRAAGSFIHVYDADDARADAGEAELSSDRGSMSVALQGGLDGGKYLVHWSSHDDEDGEVFSGCFTFFVGQAAADAALTDRDPLDGGADCPDAAESHTDTDPDAASEAAIAVSVEVAGAAATVNIAPTGFTPRGPTGSGQDPAFGHYHIYVDKLPLDVLTGHSHDEEAGHDDMADDDHADAEADEPADPTGLIENPVMGFEPSYTFEDLSPGTHTVAVALFYDDHSPFSPPVVASQSFEITGDAGDDDSGVPAWLLAVGVVAGLGIGAAGGRLIGR